MKKHQTIARGTALTEIESRFMELMARLLQSYGRGPTVSEVEEHWPGSRSGIVETAHACRAKGALEWEGVSWKSMRIAKVYRKKYPAPKATNDASKTKKSNTSTSSMFIDGDEPFMGRR